MRRWAPFASSVMAIALACAQLLGAHVSAEQAPSRLPNGGVSFIPDLHRPEDLIRLPDSPWVIASGTDGGGLTLIDIRDRHRKQLYPARDAQIHQDRTRYGGCPRPPDSKAPYFGLAVRTGAHGTDTLYAISFGKGTETSVQVFRLHAIHTMPYATWIGCVIAPEDVNLNSIAPLPAGGFVASNFSPFGKNETLQIGLARTMTGVINGQVWEWHGGRGWAKIPGTEASGANGVELSQNGKWLYIDEWGRGNFIRVSLGRTPVERKSVAVGFRIDNVHWAPDGTLLAAGQGDNATRVRVVKIDPRTLRITQLIDRPIPAGFGNSSGAAQVGRDLWVTSFESQRIAIFPPPK